MKKICCFTGHSNIGDNSDLLIKVYSKCEELVKNKEVGIFWIGNYGHFDSLATNAVRKLKEKYTSIELDLILPYVTNSITQHKEMYYRDYDSLIIADIPQNTPIKYRILKCNQYMVNCSDFLIAYVNYSFGGAIKTLKYAQKKKNIEIFNLGNI